ncbi:helix-turn-helix domain-containing protein [Exilibacterium tricleocarpae]|uniref:Helix-turn-helix domain-containing protein n=1 Tax=Exilibacterium tricleocarpae TaxID=2591008 RepID=A0A545SY46_9GAMM|nr:helix-turn-helix domain-containing protein [Exilibacterium tricleocarpae]TQV69888.1 helix-turn-helix domain-containing protein [Exilibacterium tricleocarpae]
MNKDAPKTDALRKIAVYVTNGSWSSSATMPREMFYVAKTFGHCGVTVDMVGLDTRPVITLGDIPITPDTGLAASAQYDAVVLPTMAQVNAQALAANAPLYPWLQGQHRQGAIIFGELTGVFLMAEAGLLDYTTATTHWHYADNFRRRYPRVDLQAAEMLTVQNRLYCSSAINASMDIYIHLINQFCGTTIAQQCERFCAMGSRRNYHRVSINVDDFKQHEDTAILAVQQWLEKHYAEPVTIPEVAARFGISQRNLTRRFKRATGESPRGYLQHYRLEMAKELLLNTQNPIQDICFDTGYESLTVFGRRFRQYTGMSPSAYRENGGKPQRKIFS